MKNIFVISLIAVLVFGCKDDVVPEVLPQDEIKKIAAWGDSFTQGGGITLLEYAYPVQLQKLSGVEVYNGGIGGQTSTQIKARVLAAIDKKDYNVIIWAGTNNYRAPETVKADIAEMVEFLGHKRFLIVSPLNSKNSIKGSEGYNIMMKLNNDLKDIYKENFLDVKSYLVSQSDGSVQDEQDRANDVVPTSLRSDASHLNDKGYGLIAAYIYKNFSAIRK